MREPPFFFFFFFPEIIPLTSDTPRRVMTGQELSAHVVSACDR